MKNNFDKIDESLEIKATITAKEIIKEYDAWIIAYNNEITDRLIIRTPLFKPKKNKLIEEYIVI